MLKDTKGNFCKLPIIFAECCDLPLTTQRVFTRLYSKLWNAETWDGSYPKLAQLTGVSLGAAYTAKKQLEKAGLLSIEILPNKGNKDSLRITITDKKLWALNERYSTLTLEDKENFAINNPWKTLDDLAKCLSKFESHLSKNERHQASSLSNNESHLSNFENQEGVNGASDAGSGGSTDNVRTDVDNVRTDGLKYSTEIKQIFAYFIDSKYTKATFKVPPSLNDKHATDCKKIALVVKSQADMDSLIEHAAAKIQRLKPGEVVQVFLANLAKDHTLNTWKKPGDTPVISFPPPAPAAPMASIPQVVTNQPGGRYQAPASWKKAAANKRVAS